MKFDVVPDFGGTPIVDIDDNHDDEGDVINRRRRNGFIDCLICHTIPPSRSQIGINAPCWKQKEVPFVRKAEIR